MDKLKTNIRQAQWIETAGEIGYIISAVLYVSDGMYIMCIDEIDDMVRNVLYFSASIFFLFAAILMLIHSQYLLCKVKTEEDCVDIEMQDDLQVE